MSVEAMAVVLHHSRSRGTDKVVLMGIANHEGDGGAWPSVATLAKYANVDERSVQRSLKRLHEGGEISIDVQTGGSSGVPEWKRPNRYEVLVACPATCDRTTRHRVPGLWINRVTPASPGDASVTPPGDASVTPRVTPVSPEPYLEPSSEDEVVQQPYPQDARADETATSGRCSICSLPSHVCSARTATSGHRFTPSRARGPSPAPVVTEQRSHDGGGRGPGPDGGSRCAS